MAGYVVQDDARSTPAASMPLMRRVIGFLIGGGLNTGVSYLLYLVLRLEFPYQYAYLIAYASGILFSYVFNSRFVFNKEMSWRGFLVFPAVYVVQYAVSALALAVIVERTAVAAWAAPLIVSVLTLPLTYVLTRFVLNRYNG